MVRGSRSRRSKACEPCRAKKVKCDELQPECSRCRRTGKACPGSVRGNIFVNTGPLSDRIQRQTLGVTPHPDCVDGEAPEEAHNATENAREQGSLPLSRTLGQGGVDPFSTLARRTTARENFLIEFYVRDLFPVFFRAKTTARIQPNRDAFPMLVTGISSMEGMFAYAAKYLATFLGDADSEEARRYTVLAFRGLNDALADPSLRFHNSTIVSVLGRLHELYQLRSRESVSKEEQEIDAHILGIRYLIKGRGGFTEICDDPSVSWMTIMTDLLTFGEISAGETPLSQHASLPDLALAASIDKSTSMSGNYSYSSEILAQEYMSAFGNFFLEAQVRQSQGLPKVPDENGYFWISLLFRPGTAIYRLLNNPTSVGVPRICVLFLLNIILWDHRQALQSLLDGYFRKVQISMVETGLDLDGCMDLLLWTLVTDPETGTIPSIHHQTLWLLARLLRIHKWLSKHLQAQVEDALLQFLTGNETLQPPVEIENFHLAILHDLESLQDQSHSGEGED